MARKTKAPLTPWPDGFALDGDLHRYAEEKGIPFQSMPLVWEHFENHHRAKGSVFADWRAAWRTWVLNDRRFNGDRKPKHDPIAHARARIAELNGGFTGLPLGNGNYDTASGRSPMVDYGLSQIGKPQEEDDRFWPKDRPWKPLS